MTVAYRPPQRLSYRIWPIRAVRDAAQPPARGEDEVFALENVYAQDTEVGPLLVGRPGLTKLGTGGTANLGASSTRTGQLVIQFTKRSGTTYTVVICGGKFYTYNWSTSVFTEVLTSSDFSGAFITLSSSARCYGVVFADHLVVSDGTNTPFAWDGTTNGGLTKLTNAPVCYGQPVVYYAKLFMIKNTARSTLVWSEEGVLNTGYEAGGYNNAWDLVQTSTDGIEAIAATDAALYVARANSITAISGPVSTDFKTTGTREAVSDRIGTKSPAAFQVINGRVWFLDQFGRLQITSGGEPTEIGTGSRSLLRAIPAVNYPDTQMVDDPETGHVKVYLSESGKDYPNFGVWLDRDDGSYACQETGYELSRIGQVLNGDGTPTILHVGGSTPTTSTGSGAGYVYDHGHPIGTVWSDGLHDATHPINHVIESGHLGHDTMTDKMFLRGDISVLLPTSLTGSTITFTTPNGAGTPLVLEDIASNAPQYDTGLQYDDGVQYATGGGERKVTFQMRQRGRWCRVQWTHGTAAERIGISEITLVAVPVSRRTGVL